jgi:tRNA(His) guanylyltransferase
MTADELDARMRVFESAHDQCVLPGMFMVVRLDGRNFTRNTKDVWQLTKPFDERFRDCMAITTRHLMECGFHVVYGYAQSDEISLLLHQSDATFGRKLRKILSVFAGEASAKFSLTINAVGCFDARVSQLPSAALVVDYFRWRQADGYKNALNAHCYWLQRNQGLSGSSAAKNVAGLSVSEKNELLFRAGVNFNDLPSWQKRGMGFCWREFQKSAVNKKTGEPTVSTRRAIEHQLELPMGDEYARYIQQLVELASEA